MVDPTVTTEVDAYIIPGFPVVMYRFFTVLSHQGESDLKKAEQPRTDAFKLWCWRRLSRVPWTAKRSNQSILKEISPGCSTGRTDAEAETAILWPPDVKG